MSFLGNIFQFFSIICLINIQLEYDEYYNNTCGQSVEDDYCILPEADLFCLNLLFIIDYVLLFQRVNLCTFKDRVNQKFQFTFNNLKTVKML